VLGLGGFEGGDVARLGLEGGDVAGLGFKGGEVGENFFFFVKLRIKPHSDLKLQSLDRFSGAVCRGYDEACFARD